MASPLNADVLVVGGGPAGSAAAISCARAGLRVTLLEAAHFPRHRPGETLHPGVEPLLTRLGATAAIDHTPCLRHAGVWVEGSNGRLFHPYGRDRGGPWRGYQLPRAEFDQRLLDLARSRGVRVLQGERALQLLQQGNRVAGVHSSMGLLRAAFTVDASGANAWLARQCGLPVRRVSARLLARYGYAVGECAAREDAPCFRWLPDGWEWTARIGPGLYHWTRLSSRRGSSRLEMPPAEFAGLQALGRTRGADVSWRTTPASAGPGYFLVGDAASVADPSASHGVLHALMGGMLAGHLIQGCLDQRSSASEVAAAHCRFIESSFERDRARVLEAQPHLEPAPAG